MTTVGALPPVEAYGSAEILAELGPQRRPFVELARELPAAELAAEVAPYLLPRPLTAALAASHVRETAGERGLAELAEVPGAVSQLAAALLAVAQHGPDVLAHEIALQLEAGLDLSAVTAPVRLLHGSDDAVSPPAVGRWLRERLAAATVEVVPDAGHHLLFPRWAAVLQRARDAAVG